jgi:hypothetical protein
VCLDPSVITERWWTEVEQTGLDVQVPGWFICRQLDITKQTLNYWVASGKLTPTASDSHGRPLYRYGDALEIERQTRHSPNSRRGARHRRETVGASS